MSPVGPQRSEGPERKRGLTYGTSGAQSKMARREYFRKNNMLHTYGNRIYRDRNNIIRVGSVPICRYLPERNSFEFLVNDHINGKRARRYMEIEPREFIERLTECLTE